MTVPSEVRSRKEKHACDQERQGDDSPLALPRTADAVLQLRHWLHVRLLAVGEQPLLVLSESDEVGVLLLELPAGRPEAGALVLVVFDNECVRLSDVFAGSEDRRAADRTVVQCERMFPRQIQDRKREGSGKR